MMILTVYRECRRSYGQGNVLSHMFGSCTEEEVKLTLLKIVPRCALHIYGPAIQESHLQRLQRNDGLRVQVKRL